MSAFWAIASYFNPMGFSRRLAAYRIFKTRLGIPLLTVQLSMGGRRDLQASDADRLIDLHDGDALWQKERLLNVALQHLPPEAEYVAWLDTDIVFERTDWHEQAVHKLQQAKLVQPFSAGVDLQAIDDQRPQAWVDRPISGLAFAYKLREQGHHPENIRLQQNDQTARQTMPGFAWVARRETIERIGFYDGAIVGGGDGVMAEAACGWPDHAIEFRSMSVPMAEHYRIWAQKCHSEISGEIDYVEGKLFHLWHGEISNRNYRERHRELAKFDFNPGKDILLGNDGAWKFSENRTELKQYLQLFFRRRQEDAC